jgi:hypothetical protein
MSKTNLSKSRLTDELNRNEVYKAGSRVSHNFSLKVWQRGKQLTQKRGKSKSLPVYIELKFGRHKKALSTAIFVYPDQLDTERMQITGDPEKNILLQSYISKAQQFYTELKITERPIDLALIMAAIFDYATLSAPTLISLLDLYIKQCQQRSEVGEMAGATVRKINTWHNRIKEFIIKRYGKNAPISSIVPNDATAFVLFLKSTFNYSHNSTQMAAAHVRVCFGFIVY